ncbi:MAG TPA: NADPH:quinone oxidoreductase family protein [Bacilli bacterium]|nr:NADPH:quinone oxidoreductase family protein [Bacilli bacterium]
MKSWKITQLGEPEHALKMVDSPIPVPKREEVLIKVEAAALNFFDILQCQGNYQEQHELPFTPGAEIAGVIVGKGDGVNLQEGLRVLATPTLPNGGLAEWIVINEAEVFAIPDRLSYSEAAALYITYQTAYYALFRQGKLTKGEILLVHAGSGGVGSAAIQLGKATGATVVATVGSDEKVAVCKELGADYVINYQKEDFAEKVNELTQRQGANVIFDPVGGDVFDRSRKCIAFEGRILVIGFAGGRIADAPTNHALVKNYSIVGVHFGYFKKLMPEEARKAHVELMKLYEEGLIKPLIYDTYSFEQVPEALNRLANRNTWGKLVIKM